MRANGFEPWLRITLKPSLSGVTSSGIQPVMRPDSWIGNGIMSATITYDVFYPEDHEFIQNEFLPGFYHDGKVSNCFCTIIFEII